jgi:glycerol-3-phosphate dehydrogenase
LATVWCTGYRIIGKYPSRSIPSRCPNQGTEYTRCEIELAAKREMVVKLEDFLRRRSKVSLVERTETIRKSPGILDACEILFGKDAKTKMNEYFQKKEKKIVKVIKRNRFLIKFLK